MTIRIEVERFVGSSEGVTLQFAAPPLMFAYWKLLPCWAPIDSVGRDRRHAGGGDRNGVGYRRTDGRRCRTNR